MTTFQDGPASEQRLMLKRAPVYLRAARARDGTWDALDQLQDEPEGDETMYAYVLVDRPGRCHLLRSPRNLSGWYTIARYKLVEPQPPQEIMQDNARWAEWTDIKGMPSWLEL